jgi:hypothetical protein
MASDIVDRLRHCSENCGDDYLHELAGRAAAEIERLRAALNQIASWEEGPVVSGRFDEPGAASIARAALAEEKPND